MMMLKFRPISIFDTLSYKLSRETAKENVALNHKITSSIKLLFAVRYAERKGRSYAKYKEGEKKSGK